MGVGRFSPNISEWASRKKYVRDNNLNFTILLGKDETAEKFGVNGIPDAVIVDTKGKVVFQGHPSDRKFDDTLRRLVSALKKDKMKEITQAVKDGNFELILARGRGSYSPLWKKPKGFRIVTIKGNKVHSVNGDQVKDVKINDEGVKSLNKDIETLLKLEEKNSVKPDSDAIHVLIKSKGKHLFMISSPEKSASRQIKQLVDWIDTQLGN